MTTSVNLLEKTKNNSERIILKNSSSVVINETKLSEYVKTLNENDFKEETCDSEVNKSVFDDKKLKASLFTAYNAINFSFFPQEGQNRWYIKDHKTGEFIGKDDEAHGVVAALKQYQEENPLIFTDPKLLKSLTLSDLEIIFKPTQDAGVLPMLQERLECLHSLAIGYEALVVTSSSKIIDFHPVIRLLELSDNCVVKFISLLCEYVPVFNDTHVHSSEINIGFFKRAQLLASMLQAEGVSQFKNMHKLTVFADYKIPQLLRHLGVFEYSTELGDRIDEQKLLRSGEDCEIEIRAGTIVACEMIKKELKKRGIEVKSSTIDYYLWKTAVVVSESGSKNVKPIHKCRSIYY